MRRIGLTILLTLACAVPVFCLNTINGLAQEKTTPSGFARENLSWRVGERLEYRVEVKGISVGRQVFTVVGETLYEGHPVYQIKMEIASHAALALFYRFSEENEMFLDQATLYPRYIRREIRDKKEYRTEEIKFSFEEKQIELIKYEEGEVTKKVFAMDQPCLENLSLVYYLRSRPWHRNEGSILFLTSRGPQTYDFDFTGTEEVSSPYRRMEADRIEDKNSKITVWISKDKGAIPVVIRAATDFGVINSRLVKMKY
jgi:hypothetical protein